MRSRLRVRHASTRAGCWLSLRRFGAHRHVVGRALFAVGHAEPGTAQGGREAGVGGQEAQLQRIADDLKDRELRKQQQAAIEQREWHRPPIADKPPFPKMVVDRDECNLGIFDAEQTVRNTFKITNIGPARLIMVWHPTSCTHSAGPAFPRYQEIEPGKSLDIEITSTPLEAIPNFKKVLSFWTNDPTRPDLDLSISGSVVDAKR